MTSAQHRQQRLHHIAVTLAKNEWGHAWPNLGTRLQRALIAEQVLNIAAQQDDEMVPADTVRALVTFGHQQLANQ